MAVAAVEVPVNFVLEGELAPYREFILQNGPAPVSFPAGTVLSRIGEVPERFFYLLEGIVKVSTVNSQGYVRLLGYHREDTVFVLDGLRGGEPCVVTIEAVTPLRAVPLTLGELRRLGELSPQFSLDLALFVGDTLRLMCFDAENQSIWDVATRLANFLCLYMKSRDYRTNGLVAMSQENLASAVNASRVQVARVCARFRKAGIISTGRRSLRILDRKALQELSKF